MKYKTLLLTGATGFLGSHLLEALLHEGHRVIILKRSTSDTWRIEHLLAQSTSYNVDQIPLEEIFKLHQIDYIIHLATFYKKAHSIDDIVPMFDANVTFPTKLLDLAMAHGVKGFINTGTFFEYDPSILPISEANPIKTFNLYAKSKLAFEQILKSYADEGKIKAVTLKIFSPFGPSDEGSITVKEVVHHVKQHWDKIDYEITCDPNQLHEANLLKLDCSKAHIKLLWKDTWDSETTFEKTVVWYKNFYENHRTDTLNNLEQHVADAKNKNLEWTK